MTRAARAARSALAGKIAALNPEMAGIESCCLKYKSGAEMTVSPLLLEAAFFELQREKYKEMMILLLFFLKKNKRVVAGCDVRNIGYIF